MECLTACKSPKFQVTGGDPRAFLEWHVHPSHDLSTTSANVAARGILSISAAVGKRHEFALPV